MNESLYEALMNNIRPLDWVSQLSFKAEDWQNRYRSRNSTFNRKLQPQKGIDQSYLGKPFSFKIKTTAETNKETISKEEKENKEKINNKLEFNFPSSFASVNQRKFSCYDIVSDFHYQDKKFKINYPAHGNTSQVNRPPQHVRPVQPQHIMHKSTSMALPIHAGLYPNNASSSFAFPRQVTSNVMQSQVAHNTIQNQQMQHHIQNISKRKIHNDSIKLEIGDGKPIQRQENYDKQHYINSFVYKKSNMGVISDGPVPLVLDVADNVIKRNFGSTPGVSSKQQPRTALEWNTLVFEDDIYLRPLEEKKINKMHQFVQHADPAVSLSLIDPNIRDYQCFHKPRLTPHDILDREFEVIYEFEDEDEQREDVDISPFLKTLKDISGRNGDLVLVEQTAEYPPFITNVGMASRIITYYHKYKPDDPDPKVLDSNMEILECSQPSPFIAEIPKNQNFHCITCNLCNLPLGKHPTEETDFLLVKDMEKDVFYLKTIDMTYCASLYEAKVKVFKPGDKETANFLKLFIKAILINIFRGTEQYKGRRTIQVNTVLKEFFGSNVSEPRIRSILKKIATFSRNKNNNSGNGFWEVKSNIDLNQEFSKTGVTPEQVCLYQSMLVGLYHLRNRGVSILSTPKRIYQLIKSLKGERTKKVAEKIEGELMKTPWARTGNFVKAFEDQVIQIQHTDDGQEIMRTRTKRNKSDATEEQNNTNKRKLAGTEADLRARTVRDLCDDLLAIGFTRQQIENKSRWPLVQMLREAANSGLKGRESSDIIERFARGPRNDYEANKQKYKKVYQDNFLNNFYFITSANARKANPEDSQSLDEISLLLERDMSDIEVKEEEKESSNEPVISGEDPAELVPYGVAVSRFDVDWTELGFGDYKMRTAAKVIKVGLADGAPTVSVTWRRSPHQIQELERLESFVNPEQSRRETQNLEGIVLSSRKKNITDKIRRLRNNAKKPDSYVNTWLLYKHQIMIARDTDGKLFFDLTPEYLHNIDTLSQEFQNYLAKTKGSKTKSKSKTTELADDEESDAENEVVLVHRHQGSSRRSNSPHARYNRTLKHIIDQFMNDERYLIFVEPVSKKDVPDYHLIISEPMCLRDIERKISRDEYKTIDGFYQDVKKIFTNCKTYNENRHPALFQLGEEFFLKFENMFKRCRLELEELIKGL